MPEQELNLTPDTFGVWSHDHNLADIIFGAGTNPRVGIYRNTIIDQYSRVHFGGWYLIELPLKIGDEIHEAKFKVKDDNYRPSNIPEHYLPEFRTYAHNVDDGAAPANNTEIEGWSSNLTFNYVDQQIYYFNSSFPPDEIVDVTEIVKEIIARSGWVEDNKILLISKTISPFWTDPISPVESVVVFKITDIELYIRYTPAPPAPSDYDELVVHDLEIEQEINYQLLREDVESELTFEQEITYALVRNLTVEHELLIEQDINYVQVFEVEVNHLVVILQDIDRGRVRYKELEHELAFVQDIIRTANYTQEIVHELDIEQDIEVAYVFTADVETTLDIEQDIHSNMHKRVLEHSLNVEDDIEFDPVVQAPKHVEHLLVIEQDIDAGGNWSREFEHELFIEHAMLGWVENPNGTGNATPGGPGSSPGPSGGPVGAGASLCARLDKTYHPYVGNDVSFPTEPTITYGDIVLDYPTTSPTHTITLPKPLFTNREELQVSRIQRRTRGGVLKTFTDVDWVKIRTFRFKFDHLDKDKVEEFFTFLGQTLGLKLRLTDHEGRQWDGFIVSPDGESAQYLRLCGHTTQFDFDAIEVVP